MTQHSAANNPDARSAIFHNPESLPAAAARPVLAIGNFDGVHLGHRAVMEAARRLAEKKATAAGLLTFEPHPRSYFKPQEPVFRLADTGEKARLAGELGLALVVELPFDAALVNLSADAFVEDILVKRLGVSGVVVGHDFHFGKGRSGTPEFLRAAGARHGFDVEIVPAVTAGQGAISSSAIRTALEAGDIAAANAMLGREWRVLAEVVHGEKRGRTLGYPTANLQLDPGCRLRHGIYAVRAVIDGASHPAVASFGRRPTFDNGAPLLEVHVFDYAGDLYGKRLAIDFVGWIRAEAKFDSLEALLTAMDEDSAKARALLR